MWTQISFFSSDSRPQYKSDIFKTVCLPKHYVIQFRYKREYIEEALLNDWKSLVGETGIIFFAKAQGDETGKLSSPTSNFSIREAKIVDVQEDKHTDLFLFYLELLDFQYYEIVDDDVCKIPPKLFVSTLLLEDRLNNKWLERVKAIKECFEGHLFVIVDLRKNDGITTLIPQYSVKGKKSFFLLQDETEYILVLSIVHTKNVTLKRGDKYPVLSMEDKAGQIDISINEFEDIGTNADTRTIRMTTKLLSSRKVESNIAFKISMYNKSENKIEGLLEQFHISARIERNKTNAYVFAFNSVMGVIAVGSMSAFINGLRQNAIDKPLLIVSLLLTAISSYVLFKRFNKK